jgi:hypothetical protein
VFRRWLTKTIDAALLTNKIPSQMGAGDCKSLASPTLARPELEDVSKWCRGITVSNETVLLMSWQRAD